MSKEEKTVRLYCSTNPTMVQHLANHLQNVQIEYQLTGDTATTVLGIQNPTQEVCIRVFQSDVIRAKQIITTYLSKEEE